MAHLEEIWNKSHLKKKEVINAVFDDLQIAYISAMKKAGLDAEKTDWVCSIVEDEIYNIYDFVFEGDE